METKYILQVIIGVILLYTVITMTTGTKEGFRPHFYYKRYCPDCGYKNRRKCKNCANCGYCWTYDGRGDCVPGDRHGPYFRADCHAWEYGREHDPYYFGYYFYPKYYAHRGNAYYNKPPYYRKSGYYWNRIKNKK